MFDEKINIRTWSKSAIRRAQHSIGVCMVVEERRIKFHNSSSQLHCDMLMTSMEWKWKLSMREGKSRNLNFIHFMQKVGLTQALCVREERLSVECWWSSDPARVFHVTPILWTHQSNNAHNHVMSFSYQHTVVRDTGGVGRACDEWNNNNSNTHQVEHNVECSWDSARMWNAWLLAVYAIICWWLMSALLEIGIWWSLRMYLDIKKWHRAGRASPHLVSMETIKLRQQYLFLEKDLILKHIFRYIFSIEINLYDCLIVLCKCYRFVWVVQIYFPSLGYVFPLHSNVRKFSYSRIPFPFLRDIHLVLVPFDSNVRM